jgi:hypothetical protein
MNKLIKYSFLNKENYYTERMIDLKNCSIEFKSLYKENNQNNLFNVYIEDLFSRALTDVIDYKTKEFFYIEYLNFINDRYNHFFDVNFQINNIKGKYSKYYKREDDKE